MIDDGRKRLTSWLIDDLMIGRCGAEAEDEIHRRLRHASWPQLQAPSGALKDKISGRAVADGVSTFELDCL
jgi:hypothetical protein